MQYFRTITFIFTLLTVVRAGANVDVSSGFSGAWYDPSHNGEGYLLQITNDKTALVYWFTYDAQGRQQWMLGVGDIAGSKITFQNLLAPVGGRFGPKFDPSDVKVEPWGSLVMDFSDCSTATASYSGPDGFDSGLLNLQRLTSLWGVDCDGATSFDSVTPDRFLHPGFSGSWFDETHNGEGFTVDVISENRAVVYWFTFDTLGNQAWMIGVGDIQGASVLIPNMLRPTGGKFGDDFDPDDVVANDWGPSVFTFGSCSRAAMRYIPPDNFGIESTQTLTRLTSIDRLACEFLSETFSVNGTISVAENTYIDGDINDPNWPEVSNDLETGTPQDLVTPATVVGYTTSAPTSVADDRFESESDEWDTFLVSLKEGESVELEISDWLANTPADVDLDLYLVDAEDIDSNSIDLADLADSSLTTNETEHVTAPHDSLYFIAVGAFSGASNYVLKTGLSAAAQSASLNLATPMAKGEIIAAINSASSIQSARQSTDMEARVSSIERSLGLERLNEAADGSVRYGVQKQRIDTLIPHPLTRAGLVSISPLDWMVIRNLKQLQLDPDYRWAGPNYLVQTQALPNDSVYGRQWHYPAIRLPQAWDVTTGDSSVVVAVLDSGVFEHSDLLDNVDYSIGYDFVTDLFGAADGDGIDPDASDPGEAFPVYEPYTSHGTHVAGTIGASTNNGIGVAGVAWDVTLMPVRVIGIDEGDCHDINNGLKWAGRLANDSKTLPARDADIINMSFRSLSPCAGTANIIDQLNAKGIIVIAAAGNDSKSSPVYPAGLSGVFSVSATAVGDYFVEYSNFGSSIDLAAPGGDTTTDRNRDGLPDGIWSTGMQVDENDWTPYQTLHNFQGTSMAAPHVAGVAALMKSVNPGLGPQGFAAALANGELTIDLGPTGKDNKFGYGRIDALNAVRWSKANASGVEEPTAVSSSRSSLGFGGTGQAIDLVISKIGSGPLSIESTELSDSWIKLTATSVDSDGFGGYRAEVSRAGLSDGHYSTTIGFKSDDGVTLWISVAMSVGVAVKGTAGYLYGLLVDEWTLQSVQQWHGAPTSGDYSLALEGAVPGSYFLVVGTDLDNDGILCDAGEFCQFYPSNGDFSQIEISNANIDIPYFVLTPPAANSSTGATNRVSSKQMGSWFRHR